MNKGTGIWIALLLLGGCAGNTYVPVEERSDGRGGAMTAPVRQTAPAAETGVAIESPPAPESSPRDRPAATAMPLSAPPTQRTSAPPPALLALLEQAETQEEAGQLQRALSYLERAQRISPREPLVYLQLARVRLSMNDLARATQLTERGLALSAGDSEMRGAFLALKREIEGRR